MLNSYQLVSLNERRKMLKQLPTPLGLFMTLIQKKLAGIKSAKFRLYPVLTQ